MSDTYPKYGEMSNSSYQSGGQFYQPDFNPQQDFHATQNQFGNSQETQQAQYPNQYGVQQNSYNIQPSNQPVYGAYGYEGDKKLNIADMVISIILMVVGAISLFFQVFLLLIMQESFAVSFKEADPTIKISDSIMTIGIVAAVVLVLLYLGTIFWTIMRLKAKKITFWVSLTAGVLSVIIVITALTVALFAVVPNDRLNDKEFMDKLQHSSHSKPTIH